MRMYNPKSNTVCQDIICTVFLNMITNRAANPSTSLWNIRNNVNNTGATFSDEVMKNETK